MIITREVINKNITFADYGKGDIPKYYYYNDVSKRVDLFKNYLISIGCKKGESVLIGYAPGIDQLGLFLAVCELGLNFIVNDYKTIDNEKFNFIDTKTKILSPINYFFDYGNFFEHKRNYFKKISDNYIEWSDIEQFNDDSPNNTIWAKPNDILMKCTSSGTTGTPKKVTHTHEFLYNISKRNTLFFNDNVLLVYNFNHGSSLATYFIPALMSENVKQFSNAYAELLKDEDKTENVFNNVDHVMIPYGNQLEEIIENYSFANLTYYTLSSISNKWISDYKNKYKDIISIFGCNETSGPIFINKASYDNFETAVYHKVDDYYTIESIDPLIVYLKEYDKIINTKDIFSIKNDGFEFKGRNDLLRINGLEIKKDYVNLLNKFQGYADFIYDTVYNKIYLAVWLTNLDSEKYNRSIEEISRINKYLRNSTNNSHSISKFDFLNKDDFVTGVKLDHEFLRSYFREKVKDYA
jgi:hypothetical protein